jgi:hypothetical protein
MSLALAMLFALVAPPVAVPDAGPRSGVQWDAPPTCPTQSDVEARIAARVPLERVHVRARVDASADGFAGNVAIDSAHGSSTRTLASPSCASIVDAVVLLAHVAGEPLPTHELIAPPAPAPAPAPIPEVPPPLDEPALEPAPVAALPIADAPRRAEASPRRALRLRATIGASAIVGVGTLPRIDVGVRGALGVSSRVGRAEIGAMYLAPQRVDLEQGAQIGVDAWGMSLRICPAIPLPAKRVELTICGSASAGRLRGTPSGAALVTSNPDAQPWVRLGGGPELAVAVHPRVRLVAAVDAGGHVVAPGFVIGGAGRWAPQRWGLHGLAGMQVRLP